MKIQPHTLADRMAEALAAMRAEHPTEPLEWATRDRVQLFSECGLVESAPIHGIPVVRDETIRPGRVWLRVRWSAA